MVDVKDYERLALESGAYRDMEAGILRETLDSWRDSPGKPNTLLELRDGKTLAGFAVLARTRDTEFSFDVRAICVDRDYRGTGVGKRLVEMLEAEALAEEPGAIIRFEISRRKEEALGEGLLASLGYSLIGHIPSFYEDNDDYYIYARHVSRPRAGEGGSDATAPAVPAAPAAPATGGGKLP